MKDYRVVICRNKRDYDISPVVYIGRPGSFNDSSNSFDWVKPTPFCRFPKVNKKIMLETNWWDYKA